MSATPSRPPPIPGFVALIQLRSCVPRPDFKGEPISKPWPGMVLQFQNAVVQAVESLVRVESGAVDGKESAAVEVVAAALGSELNLGATKASVLGVVTIGENFYVFHGIFGGRDDCGSAPDGAGGADPVDRIAVVLILLAGGESLGTVFCLKNTLVASGATGSLCSGQVLGIAAA